MSTSTYIVTNAQGDVASKRYDNRDDAIRDHLARIHAGTVSRIHEIREFDANDYREAILAVSK